jgi:hypothetical protein
MSRNGVHSIKHIKGKSEGNGVDRGCGAVELD